MRYGRTALLLACLGGLAAPALAQSPAPANAPQGPAGTYLINPSDELEIYVWGDERLQRVLRVLPDGTFSFPLVGVVHAAGRTTVDVEDEVEKRLAAQYREAPPQVTVSVRNAAGMMFSVIGKVRSPGTFPLSRPLDVLQALSLAGGPGEFADVGSVMILRRQGDKPAIIRTRLTDVLRGRVSANDLGDGLPTLMSGDVVVVP